MENTEGKGPTEAEILQGFSRVEVEYQDGRKEVVAIRLLTVREISQFIQRADDPAAAAELFAKKPQGWADTIKNESVFKLVEAGERINASPFAEFLAFLKARQVRSASLVAPSSNPSPASSPASAS